MIDPQQFNSLETQLVLTASRVSLTAATASEIRSLLASPLANPVDWSKVLQLAIPHGTLPLMARQFQHSAADLVPPGLLAQMISYADGIRTRNERAGRDLAEVITDLRRHGVESVPFKGAALEQQIYPLTGLREFADLDLMVKREDVIPAIQVMRALGYRFGPRHQGHVEKWLRKDHEIELVHDTRFTVDLHWSFSRIVFDLRLDPERLLDDPEPVRIGGITVPGYKPESTLLILCGHQAKHQWRRLNWLCDIAAMIENYHSMDWNLALGTARKCGCERMVLTTLALTEILLAVQLPPQVTERLDEERQARSIARRIAPNVLKSARYSRRVDLQIHEGNRLVVVGRYLTARVRMRFR